MRSPAATPARWLRGLGRGARRSPPGAPVEVQGEVVGLVDVIRPARRPVGAAEEVQPAPQARRRPCPPGCGEGRGLAPGVGLRVVLPHVRRAAPRVPPGVAPDEVEGRPVRHHGGVRQGLREVGDAPPGAGRRVVGVGPGGSVHARVVEAPQEVKPSPCAGPLGLEARHGGPGQGPPRSLYTAPARHRRETGREGASPGEAPAKEGQSRPNRGAPPPSVPQMYNSLADLLIGPWRGPAPRPAPKTTVAACALVVLIEDPQGGDGLFGGEAPKPHSGGTIRMSREAGAWERSPQKSNPSSPYLW